MRTYIGSRLHRPRLRALVVTLWILLFALPPLSAQKSGRGPLQPPHVGYVYPAGGPVGKSLRVSLGGQYFSPDARLVVEGTGVQSRSVSHFRPMTQQEFNKARDRIQELMAKAGVTKEVKQAADVPPGALAKLSEEERSEIRTLRQRMQEGNPRRHPNPAIAETLVFDLELAPDAAPGSREVRILTEQGLSNPLTFVVGTLPEILADEVVGKPAEEPKGGKAAQAGQQRAVARTETRVTLPVVVNGRILQGGVDRFLFKAIKGQRLVLSAEARSLIPYLADAVPGWFQATLTVYDSSGRELAYNDDYRFSPDPAVLFEVPADGEYSVDINDAIFRGREDFVYRLTIGELPFVTGVFPLGGCRGAPGPVELSGWNLSSRSANLAKADLGTERVSLTIADPLLSAKPIPFELTEFAEVMETEANDTPESAQPLQLPCVVNGRVGEEGDKDWFRFEGKAGALVIAEVRARRLGSPLDSQLRLLDSQGKVLAFNDDHEDKAAGLLTHHADSLVKVRLPSDGVYRVELLDVQHQAGAACAYRLHLREARPDFELRTDMSAFNGRENEVVPFTVHALRRDGFDGPITVSLKDPAFPAELSGATIPAGADRVRMTLTIRAAAQANPVRFCLVGSAKLEGRELRREAIPADDMMQAFAYRHLVEAKASYLYVASEENRRPLLKVRCPSPLPLKPGKKVHVHLPLPQRKGAQALRVELSEPPAGVSLHSQEANIGGLDIVLEVEGSKLAPGQRGNLVFAAYMENAPNNKTKGKPKTARKVALGYLPAVPFVVEP